MGYEKYYKNGWKSGESGNTPITPEALNRMESGIEAANKNLLPDPQTANNAKFLRNDNSWQTVTPANIGAVPASGGTMSGDLYLGSDTNTTTHDLYIRRVVNGNPRHIRVFVGDGDTLRLNFSDPSTNATMNHLALYTDRTELGKTLAINSGGTGATTAAGALQNLGITATAAELNKLDGVTATTAELNKLDGVTATTAELNKLDGVTATTAELNYVDGVTSNIQTQLNSKSDSGHNHSGLRVSGASDNNVGLGSESNSGGGTNYYFRPTNAGANDVTYLGSSNKPWDKSFINTLTLTNALSVASGGTGAATPEAALSNLGGVSMKVLWTNESPTSSFGDQILTFSGLTNYPVILINVKQGEASTYRMHTYCISKNALGGKTAILSQVAYDEGSVRVYERSVKITFSSGKIEFGAATANGTINNLKSIPFEIIGVKGVS